MSTMRFFAVVAALLVGCGDYELDDNVCVEAIQYMEACVPGSTSGNAQVVCDAIAQDQADRMLQMDCAAIQAESTRTKTDYINGPWSGCDQPCFEPFLAIFCAPKKRSQLPEPTFHNCCVTNEQFRSRSGECEGNGSNQDPSQYHPPEPQQPEEPWHWEEPHGGYEGGSYGACSGSPGVCKNQNTQSCPGGHFITGACPNQPAHIKCCVPGYEGTGGSYGACTGSPGVCKNQNTQFCSGGHYITGACPNQPTHIKCCVPY